LEISQGHMLSEWGTVGRSRHLCGDTSETAEQLVVLPAELANRSGNIYAGLRLLDRAGNVLQGVECGVEVHGASPSVALRRAARASLRNSVCSGFIAMSDSPGTNTLRVSAWIRPLAASSTIAISAARQVFTSAVCPLRVVFMGWPRNWWLRRQCAERLQALPRIACGNLAIRRGRLWSERARHPLCRPAVRVESG